MPGTLDGVIRWLTLGRHLAVAGLKSRRDLLLEILALRHSLLALSRSSKRPRLTPLDRVVGAWLFARLGRSEGTGKINCYKDGKSSVSAEGLRARYVLTMPDGSLTNKKRFSWLHVPDWEDDADAESVCCAGDDKVPVATGGSSRCARTTARRR